MTLRLSNTTARKIIDLEIDLYDVVNDYPVDGLLPGEDVLIRELFEELVEKMDSDDIDDDMDELLEMLHDQIIDEYSVDLA